MWGCELRSLPTGVNNNWRALELYRDLHQAAGRDYDVGRADVAVDNPRLISVGQDDESEALFFAVIQDLDRMR